MRATLDWFPAASRPLRAAGWRGYALVAAVSITAVAAVVFSFTAPNPETDRLFFSAPDSATLNPDNQDSLVIVTTSDEENSSSDFLKAPPLDPEVLIVSTDRTKVNSSSVILAAAPLESEEFVVSAESSNDQEVPPSLLDNPDAPAEKPIVGDLDKLQLNSKIPNNSNSNEGASPGGGLKVLPLHQEEHIAWTETERQLMYAKKEIDRAPIILDDPDIYAPLFKNISTFKRSYELMERILKVYIYRDGTRPIFHTPVLKGIYASEGWFLKLMEANKEFVVKNPNKAHLFYLPYGAHQLEIALYKPESHNMRPLAIFLKDYVNTISAKYPFWNRTKGADHFLVACHDWGPYTTRLHEELNKNTIKALCNADLSEGFVRGKDVSLPETLITNPKRPLGNLGGNPVSKRSILAFFSGNMHGRVRPILVSYWSGKDEDMKIYGPLPYQVSKRMSYAQHMKSSKFCICAMGYEVNSPRIVEAIYYECVPVIIADNFALPFEEVLDWSAFSVVVAERDIPNLKDILSKISPREYITMHENVKRLQKHFLWHPRPVKYDIFHMILHSVWFNRLNQIQVRL